MSRGLNKVMLIGNLGRDPEMRYTPSGRAITSFTLAVSRIWSAPDDKRHEETEWFNVVAWGNLAETCKQTLAKGQQVYVEGRLQTRKWEDPAGHKQQTIEVVADHLLLVGERLRPSGSDTPASEALATEDEFPF